MASEQFDCGAIIRPNVAAEQSEGQIELDRARPVCDYN